MKTLLLPLLVAAAVSGAATLRAAPWSLTPPPVVSAPAAPNSKRMLDPRLAPEIKLEFHVARGPFEPTWESIRRHYPGPPAWFNEAKFGVFVHWGPQASGRSGDWYARNLYREGKWWQGLDPRLLYTIDLREYAT